VAEPRCHRGEGLTRLSWDQYADRWAALHGGVDPRRARPEIRRFLRVAYATGKVLARLRIPPGAVTVAGLVFAAGAAVLAVRHGAWPALAAVLVIASAVLDGIDGAVAVVASRTTPLGYVYDATADRLSELCWLVALGLVGVPVWLVTVTLAVAWLHEYVRARGVGAGMNEIGRITIAERPVRAAFAALGLLLAALGTLFSGDVSAGSATLATAVWDAVALIGLAQLLVAVRRVLGRRSPEPVAATGPIAAATPNPSATPDAATVPVAARGPLVASAVLGDDDATQDLSAETFPLLTDPRD
jgi:phosphatidylglycerophosphate synthase